MRQFIVLTTIYRNALAVDINDIISIKEQGGTTVVTCRDEGNSWNVEESVTEIVKRINTINNKL